jgi:multiple antibiotic resistance protein
MSKLGPILATSRIPDMDNAFGVFFQDLSQDMLSVALGSFSTLLPIVNPIGNMSVFLVLTEHYEQEERNHIALKLVRNVFLLLTFFLVVGGSLLRFLGISLEIVRVAGGLVVAYCAWQMLYPSQHMAEQHKGDISFFPLAIPFFAGPGSMAVTIGLSAHQENSILKTWLHHGGSVIGIGGVVVVSYLCLRLATPLLNWVGEGGQSS